MSHRRRSTDALLNRVPLKNVDLTQEHGMPAGAFDLFNRLYVLSALCDGS